VGSEHANGLSGPSRRILGEMIGNRLARHMLDPHSEVIVVVRPQIAETILGPEQLVGKGAIAGAQHSSTDRTGENARQPLHPSLQH
jgi:hypothetical protein